MTKEQIIEDIKSTLISSATRGVVAYLISVAPFLSLPVIYQLLTLAINTVITIAVNQTELGFYDLYVDSYTAEEASAFQAAVAQKEKAQTDQEKADAEKAVIDAARTLIRLSA